MRFDFQSNSFTDLSVHPEKLALAGSERDLSWSMLQVEAEKLAATLSALNIPAGEPVIIYGHKEAHFAISMLACYLSRTTYTPIDQIYPADRVRRIITITGAKVLINCTDSPLPDGIDCAV